MSQLSSGFDSQLFKYFDARVSSNMNGEQLLGVLFKQDTLLRILAEDEDHIKRLWQAAVDKRPASASNLLGKKLVKW